jgi:hypothetical protein
MTIPPRNHSAVDQHVAFAGKLARWIERAGVVEADAVGDLAVGFADILHASAAASRELDELLLLDPTSAAGADAALTKLGYLRALFLDEIKSHTEDLERRWDMLEGAVAARGPDDVEGDR